MESRCGLRTVTPNGRESAPSVAPRCRFLANRSVPSRSSHPRSTNRSAKSHHSRRRQPKGFLPLPRAFAFRSRSRMQLRFRGRQRPPPMPNRRSPPPPPKRVAQRRSGFVSTAPVVYSVWWYRNPHRADRANARAVARSSPFPLASGIHDDRRKSRLSDALVGASAAITPLSPCISWPDLKCAPPRAVSSLLESFQQLPCSSPLAQRKKPATALPTRVLLRDPLSRTGSPHEIANVRPLSRTQLTVRPGFTAILFSLTAGTRTTLIGPPADTPEVVFKK